MYVRPILFEYKLLMQIYKQKNTYNVTIKVRSASARLFTSTWRPLVSAITTLLCCDYFSPLSVVSRTFCALCVYSKFWHHPHPTFVPNFVSFAASIDELARGEKSRTQSLNYSITQLI